MVTGTGLTQQPAKLSGCNILSVSSLTIIVVSSCIYTFTLSHFQTGKFKIIFQLTVKYWPNRT